MTKVRHDFYQATQHYNRMDWCDNPWCYVPKSHRSMRDDSLMSHFGQFNDEAMDWIRDNLTEYGFNPSTGFMIFYSEDEALLFKLTWGEGCIW